MGDTGVASNHDSKQTNRLSIDSDTEQSCPDDQISSYQSRGAATEMSPKPLPEPARRSNPSPSRQRRGRSHSRSRTPMGRRTFAPSPQDRTRIKASGQSPSQALSQFSWPWDQRDSTMTGNDRTPKQEHERNAIVDILTVSYSELKIASLNVRGLKHRLKFP
ncbi:hypothetical protein DPMN_014247 [Dreissena polymorpha]|uniref:Uncharacterized protein n=1 Tax=Dreissena polymorpha TaxID=45954 RepID=A0A9D4S4D9_DREPO|nr:hypothetical protein DPMN_014247 [Dreissena polymorpha]